MALGQAAAALQRPTKEEIRSIIVVLATGWVPTGAAAGGNILEYLLRNRSAMLLAQSAAKSNNDDQLTQCLLEAMRFRPPINPGLPRYVSEDVVIERQTLFGKRETRLKKGDVVMAAAASAMFDGREKGLKAPGRFDPSRQIKEFSREVDLQFGGFGVLHYCIGEEIAKTRVEGRIDSGFFGGSMDSAIKKAAQDVASYTLANFE